MKTQRQITPASSFAGSLTALPQKAASPRRGLNRCEAALYIGVSPSKFDELVKDGRMCPPKRVDGRVIWDIRQLDEAFDCLPCGHEEASSNPWDEF